YSLTPGATPVPGLRVQNGAPLPTSLAAGTNAALMGAATTPGVYNISIRATDALHPANYIDRAITETFTDLQILSFIAQTQPLPKGVVGFGYSFTAAPFGGSGLYQWSATGLPSGLGINASTGEISGTPTAVVSPPNTGNVSVTLKDQVSQLQVTRNFILQVDSFS